MSRVSVAPEPEAPTVTVVLGERSTVARRSTSLLVSGIRTVGGCKGVKVGDAIVWSVEAIVSAEPSISQY